MEFPKEGDSNRSNGGLGNNLTEFKQALKSGIERMQAILQPKTCRGEKQESPIAYPSLHLLASRE